MAKFEDAEYASAFARIEAHYFVNRGFLEQDDQLLRDVERMRHIRASSCRVVTTWSARCAAPGICIARGPEAQLRIVPDAGHSAFETGITRELVDATDRFFTLVAADALGATDTQRRGGDTMLRGGWGFPAIVLLNVLAIAQFFFFGGLVAARAAATVSPRRRSRQ